MRNLRAMAAVAIAAYVVRTVLLLDEEEEEAGDFGSYTQMAHRFLDRVPAPYRDEVVEIENGVVRASASARGRWRRHRVATLSAAALAGGVPVAAAANGPTWLLAALGSGAAFAQLVPQLTQDQRTAMEKHAMAVRISEAFRRYRVDMIPRMSDDEAVERTQRFIAEAAELRAVADASILDSLANPTDHT